MKVGTPFFNMTILIIPLTFLSDTYLKIFQTCFPLKKQLLLSEIKPWLTQGIRTSCANKKKLYDTYRHNKDPGFKQYYKKYCKTLRLLITACKKKKKILRHFNIKIV